MPQCFTFTQTLGVNKMKPGKHPTRAQAAIALDALADLVSDTSLNRQRDPVTWWARQRAVNNMSPHQLKRFATLALTVLEYNHSTLNR